MALGVSEGERGTPRTAVDQPVFDRESTANGLHVIDQMMRGVVFEVIGGVRRALAAAALVELDDTENGGIEVAPRCR
ncbi:hypothetical protein D3C78_1745830 [compost metagenome]